MYISKCKFESSRDIEPTVPDLAANVAELMATGVVPQGATTSNYSKMTDINEVGHYVRNKIAATIAASRVGDSIAQTLSSSDNK